jgi:hypothetical protein
MSPALAGAEQNAVYPYYPLLFIRTIRVFGAG